MSLTSVENVFDVGYAGIVRNTNFSDPCGRTELLKTLDKAQEDGVISKLKDCNQRIGRHQIAIKQYHIEVIEKYTQSQHLSIPLHIIASVGYIEDEDIHVIAVNIASNDYPTCQQNRDIAVLLLPSKKAANDLCQSLNARFQVTYREFAMKPCLRSAGSPSSSHSLQLNRTSTHALPALASAATQNTSTSIYTASDSSAEGNEFLRMLNESLSVDEIKQFALLLNRKNNSDLPIAELAYKWMELLGTHRRHLMYKFRHLISPSDQAAFIEFLKLHDIRSAYDT
ncbi:unnamed protein product [Auanema sp. JU1783]|nr:unnamed protein product [Auanema sp. JU1783]